MKDSIVVKMDDLLEELNDLKNDWNCGIVKLTISEEDEVDGDILPPCLFISGLPKDDDSAIINAEPIDEVDADFE